MVGGQVVYCLKLKIIGGWGKWFLSAITVILRLRPGSSPASARTVGSWAASAPPRRRRAGRSKPGSWRTCGAIPRPLWLAESKKAPPAAPFLELPGALLCLCAVEGREAVTPGRTGANAAFYSLDGARMPPGRRWDANGLKSGHRSWLSFFLGWCTLLACSKIREYY